MKRITVCTLISNGILITGLVFTGSQAEKEQGMESHPAEGRASTDPLPQSLDALYPPQAEQPLYLMRMVGLEIPFSGLVADCVQTSWPRAKRLWASRRGGQSWPTWAC